MTTTTTSTTPTTSATRDHDRPGRRGRVERSGRSSTTVPSRCCSASATTPASSRPSRTCPPATSQQVADAAGLDERYVREWLGGVVCAGLVDYDPARRTYALRPEARPFVTGPGADNLARSMRYIGPHGAGPAHRWPRASARAAASPTTTTRASTPSRPPRARPSTTPASSTRSSRSPAWCDALAPRHRRRRRRLRRGPRGQPPGSGLPAQQVHRVRLQRRGPRRGAPEAAAWGLKNVTFELRDVATLPTASFDLVTAFDAIHDQAHPATVLAAIRAALRPAEPSSWSTSSPRATSRTTSTCRGAASSTRSRRCTA